MGYSARPRRIRVTIMILIFIVKDNFSINPVVNGDYTDHNGQTDPVTEDVEAGKDFLYAAVDIIHLDLESRFAVLSYKVNENYHKQPA